jgi:hypothetical protein
MIEQILSYVFTFLGLAGFWLAGRKVWWCWYINIVNQFLWTAFALITGYYALIIGSVFYFVVFTKNAIQWTRDHFQEKSEPKRLLPEVSFQFDSTQFHEEIGKVEAKFAELEKRLPPPDTQNKSIDLMSMDQVRSTQRVFIGNDGHVCHAEPMPGHMHATVCPTGAHPTGWQHPTGDHKMCTICR